MKLSRFTFIFICLVLILSACNNTPTTQTITTQRQVTAEEQEITSIQTPSTTDATERTTPQYIIVVFENMQAASGTTVMSGIKDKPFFLPEEPIKQGYVFDGWYMEASCQLKK